MKSFKTVLFCSAFFISIAMTSSGHCGDPEEWLYQEATGLSKGPAVQNPVPTQSPGGAVESGLRMGDFNSVDELIHVLLYPEALKYRTEDSKKHT